MMTDGVSIANHICGSPYSREATMPDTNEIMHALLEALPPEARVCDELAALGAVTAGVINTISMEQRSDLVERFCSILRKQTAMELNA